MGVMDFILQNISEKVKIKRIYFILKWKLITQGVVILMHFLTTFFVILNNKIKLF